MALKKSKDAQLELARIAKIKEDAELARLRAPIFAWIDDDEDLFLAPKHANVLQHQTNLPVEQQQPEGTAFPETPVLFRICTRRRRGFPTEGVPILLVLSALICSPSR